MVPCTGSHYSDYLDGEIDDKLDELLRLGSLVLGEFTKLVHERWGQHGLIDIQGYILYISIIFT